MTRLLLILVALVLAGSNCEPGEPPPPGNDYCQGTPPPTAYESVVQAVSGMLSTIIGGTPSTDRRATAFVQIGTSGYCSGTVISTHTVLTAAHCLGDPMRVTIDGLEFTADEVLKHPDYVTYPNDDLLLLFFEQVLPGPYVGTVYNSTADHGDCTALIAQGWGKSETPEVDLNESFYSVVRDKGRTLHTKQVDPGGICFGDSGGPLYAEVGGGLQLAGVTSTTYSQDCLVGGDHVDLSYYRNWIEDNTR